MRKEPRGYRQITVVDVVAAAVAIADDQGVERLTMREVADALDVGTMSIYHYVRNKNDLRALMDDQVMGEMVVGGPLPEHWRDAVTLIARRMREVLLGHPWALTGMRSTSFSVNTLRRVEEYLAATARTPLPVGGRLDLIATVTDFVCGFVLKSDLEPGVETITDHRQLDEQLAAELGTGKYVHLSDLLGGTGTTAAVARAFADVQPPDIRFGHALDQLLIGIERSWSSR
ncbi:MAG: TetR/AcrR family transcriptional regulator [Pseudonocardia sp.]|nr:TetR/AcrR family transcriptional regulator [Pseudonocardia sp.]